MHNSRKTSLYLLLASFVFVNKRLLVRAACLAPRGAEGDFCRLLEQVGLQVGQEAGQGASGPTELGYLIQ